MYDMEQTSNKEYLSFKQLVAKWSKFTLNQRDLLGEAELLISKTSNLEKQEIFRNYLHLLRDCEYINSSTLLDFMTLISIVLDSDLFKGRYKKKYLDSSESWLYYCEEFFTTWFSLFSQTNLIKDEKDKKRYREILVYILEYILSRYYIKLPSEMDSIEFGD